MRLSSWTRRRSPENAPTVLLPGTAVFQTGSSLRVAASSARAAPAAAHAIMAARAPGATRATIDCHVNRRSLSFLVSARHIAHDANTALGPVNREDVALRHP